jgi:hypothetical protein
MKKKAKKVFVCTVTGENWSGPMVLVGKTKEAVEKALLEWVLDQDWGDREPPLTDPVGSYFNESGVGGRLGESVEKWGYTMLL